MNKIAIVGGSGFIGESLAKHLSGKYSVKVLDIQPPQENVKSIIDYTRCDVSNYQEVVDGLEGVDLVIHTAIIQIPLINEKRSLGYKVNVIGTQNVCKAVEETSTAKGMILAGTWHTIGERDLHGVIDEEFGFRPDKVEDRARLYAMSKILQETIVRYHDEISQKTFGIIRTGTVLGEKMPKETAASAFIRKGLSGEPITPYKHSMHRPMLYVDIRDVCKAYETYASIILSNTHKKGSSSLMHIVNVYHPQPITILKLAQIIQGKIIEHTKGKISPQIQIVDTNMPPLFKESDKRRIRINIEKAKALLGFRKLIAPEVSLSNIIQSKLKQTSF